MRDAPDAPPPPRRRSLRLSVRGLLALVALVGLAMGLGLFWLENVNPDRATLSYQMRLLADREAPAEARLGAVDGMIQARGRQARRAMGLLAATLGDPDPALRAGAAGMIAALGRRIVDHAGPAGAATVRPAARRLFEAIDDPSPEVSAAAIRALRSLDRGERDPLVDRDELAAALHALLRGDRGRGPRWADARAEAIGLLAARELDSGEPPDWLLKALGDPDPQTRLAVLRALVAGADRLVPGAGAAPAPAWLFVALEDPAVEVRQLAIWNCSIWPSRGRAPGLPRWAADDRGRVREALRRVLDRAEGEERLAAILNLLVHEPAAAARFAPEVIGGFEARLDADPPGWSLHLQVLEQLGPAALPAVPALCSAAGRAMAEGYTWTCVEISRIVTALAPESDEAQALLAALVERLVASADLEYAELVGPSDEARRLVAEFELIRPSRREQRILVEAILNYAGPALRSQRDAILRFEEHPILRSSAVQLVAVIEALGPAAPDRPGDHQ